VGGGVAWERRSGAAAALGEAVGGGSGAPGEVRGRRRCGGGAGGGGPGGAGAGGGGRGGGWGSLGAAVGGGRQFGNERAERKMSRVGCPLASIKQ
jgi:hypothetical protein